MTELHTASIEFKEKLPGLTKVIERIVTEDGEITISSNIVRSPALDESFKGKEMWMVVCINPEPFAGGGVQVNNPMMMGTYEECKAYFTDKK
jgi:hypothetical protein